MDLAYEDWLVKSNPDQLVIHINSDKNNLHKIQFIMPLNTTQ